MKISYTEIKLFLINKVLWASCHQRYDESSQVIPLLLTWPAGFPAPAPSPSPACSRTPCDDGSLAAVARQLGAPAPLVAPPVHWPGAPAEGSPGAAAHAAPPKPLTPSPAPPLDAQVGAPGKGTIHEKKQFMVKRVKNLKVLFE